MTQGGTGTGREGAEHKGAPRELEEDFLQGQGGIGQGGMASK